jgi:hypothetical protein
MKAYMLCLGAVLTAALAASDLGAGPYPYGPMMAPGACGKGLYYPNSQGGWNGPCYWLQPGFRPFNGPVPPGGVGGGPECFGGKRGGNETIPSIPIFPTHPFARSPRDYFMVEH